MILLAIDPGYEQSAYLLFNGQAVGESAIEPNAQLLARLLSGSWWPGQIGAVAIESLESFGMPVGRETFETVFLTGRIYERARARTPRVDRLTRREVKVHLCHSARATDASIRIALIDRFGGTAQAVGVKAAPGPLYRVKSHLWAALAVAVTWWDREHETAEQRIR